MSKSKIYAGLTDRRHYTLNIDSNLLKNPYIRNFVDGLSSGINFINNIDPYNQVEREQMSSWRKKLDGFLYAHSGLDYSDFSKLSKPQEFNSNDFRHISKDALKKRLFEYRTQLYLNALSGCEERGLDIKLVIEEIKKIKIPPIKKELKEPTFEALSKVIIR